MAKMAASVMASGEDVFRKMFKFYKRRVPAADYRDVTDFSAAVPDGRVVSVDLDCAAVSDQQAASVGLKPVREWRAFGLQSCPGLIFISNPFLSGCQAFWVRECLKSYPQKPNICNLDMHMSPCDTQDIWTQSLPAAQAAPPGMRPVKTLLERLRWVTLGYHYHWDSKTYSSSSFTPFPADLHLLSVHVSAACGFPHFSSEAGIINYYRLDSSLGIHVDESELDHSRPLLSFSFGQSAIFLLGGPRRQDPPHALYVHSGDVMVMSGQSRLCFHAVPRVLPPPHGHPACEAEGVCAASALPPSAVLRPVCAEDWAVCSRYLQSSRVCVTVRQVLGPGQMLPDRPTPGGAGRERAVTEVSDQQGASTSYHGNR